MTFSIVARSADGESWGVAVASKFLAVGAVVPAARAKVWALATQSYANPRYGPNGLALLREGLSAAQVVDRLTSADEDRAHRQVGIVDALGRAATFTGEECHEWAGGRVGTGCNELGRAADLARGGKPKDFVSAAEVGKCDAGRTRGVHAHGARAPDADQEEGPDRPAQPAKGAKHCLSHAVDRQCHCDVVARCNEYRPARPEFR